MISQQSNPGDGYSTKGQTKVLSADGEVLASLDSFVGRSKLLISPDADLLVLYGGRHSPSKLSTRGDDVIASIYHRGKLRNQVLFSDLFTRSAGELAEIRNLSTFGGGWVRRTDFITGMGVDWQSNLLTFALHIGRTVEISLETTREYGTTTQQNYRVPAALAVVFALLILLAVMRFKASHADERPAGPS